MLGGFHKLESVSKKFVLFNRSLFLELKIVLIKLEYEDLASVVLPPIS
jgi:hypothetical protein